MNKSENLLDTNQEQLENLTKNYVIDDNNYYMNRTLKFLLNFLLTYCFISFFVYNDLAIGKNEFILIICTFSSILLFILDSNFPCYSLKL